MTISLTYIVKKIFPSVCALNFPTICLSTTCAYCFTGHGVWLLVLLKYYNTISFDLLKMNHSPFGGLVHLMYLNKTVD